MDVGGTCFVGLACEGAGELLVLDLGEKEDLLAGLDVGADPDDELRVALETFVHRGDRTWSVQPVRRLRSSTG